MTVNLSFEYRIEKIDLHVTVESFIVIFKKILQSIFHNSIKHFYDLKSFEDIVTFLDYKKNEELNYSADLNDSLFKNIFCLAYMFKVNHFV